MENNYRHTNTTVSLINYHFVFCPRYRRKIFLIPNVEQRFKTLVNEKCKELEIGIIAIECDKDHVHMFLNCLPIFEHGFKKLSLREVRLRLGDEKGKNHNRIICADTSDYSPKLYSYGDMFLPIARIGKDEQYNETDEFKLRLQVYMDEIQRIVDERPKKNSED